MVIKIYLAEHAGFCFGVKRAVEMAYKSIDDSVSMYSYGDLVHNPHVVKDFKDKGVVPIEDYQGIKNSKIILRSHGVHKKTVEEMKNSGNTLVECVCPFVSKIYKIVEEHQKKGYEIVIIGDSLHPEVISINSHCDDKGLIINNLEEIDKIPIEKDLCIVSQTTNNLNLFNNLINEIKSICKGEVLVYNTICNATSSRQEACKDLAKKVDAMIVIGGKKSSNTKKLAEVAKEFCQNVFLIESINDIEINKLKKFNKIGITAGASTPDSVIKEAVCSMENLNNNEMMEAIDNSFTRVRRGEIVNGEVLFVTDNEVMVNINYRSDGIISKEELSNNPEVNPSDLFKQGDEIQVYILKMDDGDGNVVLSYKRVENMKNWDVVEEKFNDKERVNVTVKSVVKGGLTCEISGLNGFIPASHASTHFQKDLEKFVGQELECEIIDFDKAKRKIVLSRKNVELEEIEAKKKEVYESIKEGDVIEGTVQRLTNFGAFVDIGGVDGLIHISELSWNRVKHPADIVAPGDVVKVQVLKVDEEKNRIALGLKQTTEKPWDVFSNNVGIGDVVEGTVVNLLDFGAFVRLDSGVDGLLHVSQIAKEHVEKPADKLAVGDKITVKVTDINEEDKKISLSIKALFEEDEEPDTVEEEYVEEVEEVVEPVQENNDFNTTIGDLINLKEQN